MKFFLDEYEYILIHIRFIFYSYQCTDTPNFELTCTGGTLPPGEGFQV